jgi:hypothetical protein
VKHVQDEEFLRNVVRLRYSDSMNSLDVASIAAQYELGASAEARPFFIAPNPSNSNVIFRTFTSILPDLSVSGANRPTITLVPNDDAETTQRYMRPASAESIIFFAETGWPVSTVFRLWLDSLNHVPNASAARGGGVHRAVLPEYARFRRAVDLIQFLEDVSAAARVVEERERPLGRPIPAESVTADAQVEAAKNGWTYSAGSDPQTSVLSRRERRLVLKLNPQALASPEVLELCDLLGLVPGRVQYELSVGKLPPFPDAFPPERQESIDLVPRSPIQVLFYLAHGVEIPPEHMARGVARTTTTSDGRVFDWQKVTEGLFKVCYAHQHSRPANAYVAVHYRGYWFYIDDRDIASKQTFNLMLQLSRIDLGSSRGIRQGPVLTLPIGR